jgi:hypothetical protein
MISFYLVVVIGDWYVVMTRGYRCLWRRIRWLLLWFLVVFGLLFPFCCFLLLFEGWSSTLKVLFISCYCKLCCCCCGGFCYYCYWRIFIFFWLLVCGIAGWDATTYTVLVAASWETWWLFPHVACWCYCCVCCWNEAIVACFKLLLLFKKLLLLFE